MWRQRRYRAHNLVPARQRSCADAQFQTESSRRVSAIPETNYGIRLRALLALYDVKLYFIAFFKRLVPIQLNGGIVNEYIRSIFASDESVTLGVIEPLNLSFVLSHRSCLP